jgi:hypothetical protein
MLHVVQVLAVLLVSVTMALALAHALEFPGKMRLAKEQYLAVQQIYYPGFAVGGAAEPLSVLITLALLLLMSRGSSAFWLTAGAFVLLLAMHAAYWLLTHPVNNFWLKDVELRGAGAGFFSFDLFNRARKSGPGDWTQLRDRWEYSHVARAGLGLAALTLLVSAVVVS